MILGGAKKILGVGGGIKNKKLGGDFRGFGYR